MRILIVDDNASMRKVLAALFASLGHQVVAALPDGSAVESTVQQTAPDLVCLDYHLPGRDGLSILRAIQTMAPEIDVVFMTASSEAGIEGKAADAGASGFIRKPFGQEQIIAELKAVEETRKLEKASAQRAASGGAARKGRRGTAVIADDNGSVRLVLKALLEESGLQVVQMVSNGNEAVVAAKAHQPGLLCLDVNMPVMGGIDALPLIKEASPQTAVVMVTGEADKTMVAQAAGLGAVGYILKPLRPAYVEGFIRRLFG
ncbi:MAG: response regulator [Azonexaceae bacterium]|nr:response regulator [Azonexaceae bacterium]